MSKSVRLSDIGDCLGVSAVTVSKALSGQKGVGEELRKKIISLADEMGYQRSGGNNSNDKYEFQNESYSLAILIPENYIGASESFYLKMYQTLSAYAVDRNCFTVLSAIDSVMESQKKIPSILSSGKVDGIIVIGKLNSEYLEKLKAESRIPLIYVDFEDGNRGIDTIISDSYYGAYRITRYLIDKGHKNIAFVGTVLSTESITDRYFGYSRAMLEAGLKIRDEWIINDRDVMSGVVDDVNLISLPKVMPTAFFCNCDVTAGMLINKLKKNGYRVPEDISVAGYDNYIKSDICDIGITTYEVDVKAMARKALDNMINKLSDAEYVDKLHIIEGRLVEKNSVRSINE